MMRARRDFSETAFMVFVCLMMVIGGLSEGYPGLAVFGGLMLALLALATVLQFVGPVVPRISELPRPVLIILAIPVAAVALYMATAGDGEMRLWGILLAVGWAGLIVASFLPEGERTLEIKLPGIRLEGAEAEAMARKMGVDVPDPAGLGAGETREQTVVKEIELRPEDLGRVEEAITRMVLGAHGVKVRTGVTAEDALSRARGLLAAGGAEAALPELEAVTGGGDGPEGARELRGRALVGLGRFEDALAELGGIRAGPGAADAWFARGEACRALGRDDEGRAAFEQAAAYALSEPPGEAISDPAVLPLALERMGNADGAARALDMRLAAAPGHGSLLCVEALLSATSGSPRDVTQALEGAIATHPYRVLQTLAEPALAVFAEGDQGQELRRRAERERQRLLERLLASG